MVAEGATARRAVLAELAGAGWHVGGQDASRGVSVREVASSSDAEAVVLAALRGDALLITAPSRADMPPALGEVVDDLLDDLAGLGSLRHVTAATAVDLDAEAWRLAHALASGVSLETAAREHHVSPRTAHRRVSAARAALRANSRAQLVRALAAPDRIPPVSDR